MNPPIIPIHPKLGNTIFRPLEAHTGGYQGIDAWGHQILLNYRPYRSLDEFVSHVTLGQVLTGQISADVVKNRVVLIGTTAASFRDYSLTPYRTDQGASQTMPGVVLQAQMVSQILSAVLDGRPLLWTLPIWGELLWIGSWALTGSILALRLRHIVLLSLASGIAIAGLYGICLGLLIKLGCWIPLVPAALAFLASIIITAISIALIARQQFTTSHLGGDL